MDGTTSTVLLSRPVSIEMTAVFVDEKGGSSRPAFHLSDGPEASRSAQSLSGVRMVESASSFMIAAVPETDLRYAPDCFLTTSPSNDALRTCKQDGHRT